MVQDPAALVERLGSDDIEIRQRAEADLIRLGPAAVPALDAASKRGDPELASRARSLLLEVIVPHRREVDRELAHMAIHGRPPSDKRLDMETAMCLKKALALIDPEHPFATSTAAWESGAPAELRTGLRYPDAARWAEVREKVARYIELPGSMSTCAFCVRRRLAMMKVSITFENARFEDVIAQIETLGAVRVLIDGDVRFDHAVTVKARGALGEILDQLFASEGLTVRVLEGGTILAVKREGP